MREIKTHQRRTKRRLVKKTEKMREAPYWNSKTSQEDNTSLDQEE
jgi:hypothetical protein